MEEVVICVDSYLLYKNALYIAAHNYQERPVTVLIPGNPDLFKFFNLVNEKSFHNSLNLIYFEPFRPNPRRVKAAGLKKIYYVLIDIIRESRYLKETFNKYLTGIEGCEVFLLARGSMQFFMAKGLSKRNKLVYISSYNAQVAPGQYAPVNILDLARLIIFNLTYGGGIALGKLPHRAEVFPYMSARFLEKEFDRVVNEDERDEMLKGFELSQFNIFDTSQYRVIFFVDAIADYTRDENTFMKELVGIFDILSRYFPENEIALKYHPCYGIDETRINIGDILPNFIPAELLYDDNVKIYLGVCSAAMTNVEKGLVVSILDLISSDDKQTREKLKEILLRTSRTNILFPRSLNELGKILREGK